MRILHILDHSLPLHSGYAFRTLAILREQRRLGWDTHQLTTPRHGPTSSDLDEVDGWRFHRTALPTSAFTSLPGAVYVREMAATTSRLLELARRLRPDVLHAHSPVLNALPALWAGRRLGLPVVYEVRALWEDGAVDQGVTHPNSLRYRGTRALETFVLKHASHVTTICQGLENEIATRGVARDRITIVPNAVDPEQFSFGGGPDREVQARHALAGCTVLGFIGSFYAYEGLELLVDAFVEIARRRADARLLFAGGGMREDALRLRVRQQGLGDRVVFAGRVPHAEVSKYYSVIDLLVYPRLPVRLTELVTPLKPLEAMAHGRPLLASDVGGHRELIRDGETGFLFRAGSRDDLVEKAERVLSSERDRSHVREQARRFVEQERTWRASVGRYASVYDAARRRTLVH